MKRIAYLLFILFLLSGCGGTFYTHVEGENDMIGIKLPVESDIQLDIVHHVNGTTMTVKQESTISHEYTITNSNSYFGIIHIFETRDGRIKITPKESNKTENEQPIEITVELDSQTNAVKEISR